jgi:hypothetical protein
MNIERLKEIIISQEKRGFDQYLLAPFLLFVAYKYDKLPKKIRRVMFGAGVFQLMYAYKNYIKLKEDTVNLISKQTSTQPLVVDNE